MAKLVIDPGHGGNAEVGGSSPNNATGPTGLKEKEVCLQLCMLVSEGLTRLGHEVRLTRSTDVNVGLLDRARVAKDWLADAFVSIHLNGDGDPRTQGSEAYHQLAEDDKSALLAESILQNVVASNGYRNRGVKISNDQAVTRRENHFLQTAVCLVEVSFLTNPVEENLLKGVDYRIKMANAIIKGIDDFAKGHST